MTTTYEPNVVLSTKEYDVVGTRPIRHDGADKVTGKARYGADYSARTQLYGKILRSPHAHAKIKSIDTSKAEALEGVRAVVTHKDFPTALEGDDAVQAMREGILASDRVRFKGHPVAGVAALNVHIAEEAIGLIEVEYEVLGSVMTTQDAMKDGAPILYDDLRTDELGETVEGNTNVAQHIQYSLGDIDKGFAEADVIIEREFNTATVHQGYIEPHNCTVDWNKDGRVYIWNSTQAPFDVRDQTAQILGLDVVNAKLTPLEIGGGFGGKWEPYGEPVAALLSKNTDHPVKIVHTRTEEFDSTGPTPGSNTKVKIGATKDGKFTAAKAYIAFEAGFSAGSVIEAGAQCVFACYDIENGLIDGYDVVVNKPKSAAYRAPGSTHVAMATETVVDELSKELGIDPIELRLLNAAKEGTRRVDGPRFPRIGCVEVLEALRDHPHYQTPLEGPNQGRGLAVGFWFNAGMQSSCSIAVNADGSVTLVEGSPDIGGSRVGLAMQAAETLGITAEEVRPAVVDTDSIGYTAGTGGSRVTFATGWAVYEASQDVKRQMVTRAATIWDIDADSIEMEKGIIQSKTDSEFKMTFRELAAQLNDTGGPIMGRGTVDPSGEGGAFCANIVDVEVDPDTGKVDVIRVTAVQDAGKAIHPSYVEGQIQGGTVQGIGWALNEEYFMSDKGTMTNSTFLDYRMPTSLDAPMIDTVIVEVANPGHPYGVRGVGEVCLVPPPAAIANAIHDAAGVRLRNLPMNSGVVMNAIWNK